MLSIDLLILSRGIINIRWSIRHSWRAQQKHLALVVDWLDKGSMTGQDTLSQLIFGSSLRPFLFFYIGNHLYLGKRAFRYILQDREMNITMRTIRKQIGLLFHFFFACRHPLGVFYAKYRDNKLERKNMSQK